MKNYSSLLFAVIAVIIVSACSRSAGYSPEIESKISQVENNLCGWVNTGTDDNWNILDRMKRFGVKGMSIAVIHNYKIEWAKGYGMADVIENRPVTERTLFQAASISKSLNSLGVLKLVEKNKLSCDSDVNNFLVSWKFPYDTTSHGKKITVKELLSHTAGLSIHGFPGYDKKDKLPTIIQILNGEPPANTKPVRSVTEPGKNMIYSGGGTTILQLIVTDLTGIPYEEYMQKEVLNPLGMISSCYCQPPDGIKPELLATGYHANGKEVPGKYHIYPEKAAAGLWTNPTDLCKYVIETQLAWKGESHKVLSTEMTRFRLTPVIKDQDAALGTFVNSRVTGSFKYFNHNGGNAGFSCTAYGCRDSGDGVVIMTNSDNGSIIEEILNSVAKVYNWKDFYIPEIKKPVKVSVEQMQRFTGKYEIDGETFNFILTNGELMVKADSITQWPIYFTSDSDFFVRESRGMARFFFGKDGKVAGFKSNGMVVKKMK